MLLSHLWFLFPICLELQDLQKPDIFDKLFYIDSHLNSVHGMFSLIWIAFNFLLTEEQKPDIFNDLFYIDSP